MKIAERYADDCYFSVEGPNELWVRGLARELRRLCLAHLQQKRPRASDDVLMLRRIANRLESEAR